MSQKKYLYILQGGVYLSFLCLFFVFDNLLFPFITSKQIPFNILIEVLFIFWLAFLIKYPSWRPPKDLISIGLLVFFGALLLSSFTGVDFNLSFWGDIERMLGVFPLLHFLAFYLIIITVFRDWRDWRNLLMVSVAAAVVETFYVLFGERNYGTFGNTSYVSGYMIFNIYFALILFFRQKNWLLRAFYVIGIILMFLALQNASTRGAYIGFGLSIVLLFFMVALFSKRKVIRFGSIGLAALFVLAVVLVYMNADSAVVKSSGLLRRITEINTQAATFQTRLISWGTAWKDFPNHPVLGTGYGNFAITFDKFFDPKFYDYTRGETYFDHAHNNLVDIATTTGAVGLITYLFVFGAVVYYLITGLRRGKVPQLEFILLVSLLAAYFIQNIVLFDSFVTYLSLMVTFGLVYWLNHPEKPTEQDEPFSNREFSSLLIAGALMLFLIFQYNYKPYQMLTGTIAGQVAMARNNDLAGAVSAYKKALSIGTPLDRDSRASLGQLIISQGQALYAMDKTRANQIIEYVIGELKKNVALNPGDSFMQMTLAQTFNLAASINGGSQDKFFFYSNQAEEAIDKSIEASPRRVPIYFIKAQILLTRSDKERAIETLDYAISLNPKYPDGYCQLARVYFYYQQPDLGYKNMDSCIDYRPDQLGSAQQLGDLIKRYADKQDWPRTIWLYTKFLELVPGEAKAWAGLASVYEKNGDLTQAVEAAKKAAELDPAMRKAAEEFIRRVEGTSNQ